MVPLFPDVGEGGSDFIFWQKLCKPVSNSLRVCCHKAVIEREGQDFSLDTLGSLGEYPEQRSILIHFEHVAESEERDLCG